MFYKDKDLELWRMYKQTKSPVALSELLRQMDPLIRNTVSKWVGAIPTSVLMNEAKVLAVKAFDTYDPNKGTALSTHVVSSLAPISRMVYTYQNTARMPENVTLKLQTFNNAYEYLSALLGREPNTDELHQELGWSASDIKKIQNYQHAALIESGPQVSGDFFTGSDYTDKDEDVLSVIYFELLPEEKKLFEMITGYNGHKKLTNQEIIDALGITQAQLSYKKTLLTQKIHNLLSRYHGTVFSAGRKI